jgi:hypothetical protein
VTFVIISEENSNCTFFFVFIYKRGELSSGRKISLHDGKAGLCILNSGKFKKYVIYIYLSFQEKKDNEEAP